LLLWAAWRGTPAVLAGLLVATTASYSAVFGFDRDVWSQYAEMMRSNVVQYRFAPTLSAYLRWEIAPGAVWLELSSSGSGLRVGALVFLDPA